MKVVGLVTDKGNRELSPSDRVLIEPLKKYGFKAEPAVWDDNKTEWGMYDLLIVRSCWNYYQKYREWLEWLDGLMAKNTKVWNPIEIMKWNSHKSYLLELEQRGAKIVPSKMAKAGENLQGKDTIIKPLVGAGAHNLRRIKNQAKLEDDCLVQPYIKEVQNGEYSLVFFNKQYSHGIIKMPKKNDFRVNFAFGGSAELAKIPFEYIQQAMRVLKLIPSPLLYARVDGVIKDNEFLLMELELIEPYLFFDLCPQGAASFAKVLYEFN
jgi:glutathione synthase/RimK-type ligase-like ATP-grasp enzyme